MSRPVVRSIARLLACVLLLAQLAVAAYACPGLTAPAHGAPIAVSPESDDAAPPMPGCSGMPADLDRDAPNLCAEHCKAGKQSADVPTVTIPVPWLTTLYTVPPTLPDTRPERPASARIDALVAASPPHAVLHCVYRI